MKVTAPAQGQALAHLKDDAERKIRFFLIVHVCTGCLSSHPSALLAVSEFEIEFEELFDRLVLCAETYKLQCETFFCYSIRQDRLPYVVIFI